MEATQRTYVRTLKKLEHNIIHVKFSEEYTSSGEGQINAKYLTSKRQIYLITDINESFIRTYTELRIPFDVRFVQIYGTGIVLNKESVHFFPLKNFA